MYRLQVKTHFDAAHRIKDYKGKCNRLHGHRWEVEAVIEGLPLDDKNMLVDFSVVKGLMKGLIDSHLDHYYLNETLQEENLTAELLARWMFDRLQMEIYGNLNSPWLRLARVTIWESPDCCVKYYGNNP